MIHKDFTFVNTIWIIVLQFFKYFVRTYIFSDGIFIQNSFEFTTNTNIFLDKKDSVSAAL